MNIPLPDGFESQFPKFKSRRVVSTLLFVFMLLFYPVEDLFGTMPGILLLLIWYVTVSSLIEWMHHSFLAKASHLLAEEFSIVKRWQYFTLILVTALILSMLVYFSAWWLVARNPGSFSVLMVFIPCLFLMAMSFYYDARLVALSESMPSILVMHTVHNRAIKVSLANLLLVIPVISQKKNIQAFDKEGKVFLCARAAFEKIAVEDQRVLEKIGDIWVDKKFWDQDANQQSTLPVIGVMGGLANVLVEELLMMVKKNNVYTLFTDKGVFYMPALKAIKKICPPETFEHRNNFACRKGMKPEEIQKRIYQKQIETSLKQAGYA